MQHQHTRTLEASLASHSSGGASYDGQIAGLYDLEETLGSGHFAVVKLARHVFTGAKVAVKVVDKTKLDDVSKAHLFQEVRCMKLVQHPNVVRLYEVIDTKNKLYLVLELGDGGDLYDYIMRHDGGLNENLARKYFRQILRAITYCHELHVVHRDLKPENVVFFEKLGVVKLTDFGFSNKFKPGQKLQTFCGSLAYSAPEILLGDSYDAPAVDIWSLGVILYMLVCGQPPFEKANDSETLTMIMDCKYTIPSQVTQACCKLIGSMLVRDPKKRATLQQIAAHPWLNENVTNDDVDSLPLVKREQISEEDHAFIIQKMINGNIATKEDIVQALDKDKYNHITATYFLLAEIRLRKRREEMQYKQNAYLPLGKNLGRLNVIDKSKSKDKGAGDGVKDSSEKKPPPINIVCMPDHQVHEEKRTRKCSIVREEDEEESSHELSCDTGNELKVAVTRRESISDGRLNRSIQERVFANVAIGESNSNEIDNNTLPKEGNLKEQPQNKLTTIVKVDATLAQKLHNIDSVIQTDATTMKTQITNNNQIATLTESLEIQDTLRGLEELKLKTNPKNPVLTHHRRHSKLTKIRTPSCSSSEASDDDTKTRSKKKIHKFGVVDAPVRFRIHRRDSHDDSSDSQDQSFKPSATHAGHDTTALITNNSNINNKKDNQNQNKNDETRHHKSSHTHDCGNIVDGSGNANSQITYNKFTSKIKQSKEYDNCLIIDNNKHQHHSLMEQKAQAQNLNIHITKNLHRRRIRESQSLDRITEAQEYELLRYQQQQRSSFQYPEIQQPIYKFPVTNEDVKIEENENTEYNKNSISVNIMNINNSNKRICSVENSSIYKLSAIDEVDFIWNEKNLNKNASNTMKNTQQPTKMKCLMTMKKIRKLGRYFPVMNVT